MPFVTIVVSVVLLAVKGISLAALTANPWIFVISLAVDWYLAARR